MSYQHNLLQPCPTTHTTNTNTDTRPQAYGSCDRRIVAHASLTQTVENNQTCMKAMPDLVRHLLQRNLFGQIVLFGY